MPRRARDRRRGSSADALAARLDRMTGLCIAVQLRSVDGTPAMLLMGDDCAACRAFRAGIPVVEPRPVPRSAPAHDLEEEIDL